MTHADIVYTLDMKYAREPVQCPNDGTPSKSGNGQSYTEHGNLNVHSSGSYLICGRCEYKYMIGKP